jgi:hypothetical protein
MKAVDTAGTAVGIQCKDGVRFYDMIDTTFDNF